MHLNDSVSFQRMDLFIVAQSPSVKCRIVMRFVSPSSSSLGKIELHSWPELTE